MGFLGAVLLCFVIQTVGWENSWWGHHWRAAQTLVRFKLLDRQEVSQLQSVIAFGASQVASSVSSVSSASSSLVQAGAVPVRSVAPLLTGLAQWFIA